MKWLHIHSTRCTAVAAAVLAGVAVDAQLVINQTQPPTTLVQTVLMGSGVFATNVTFNGNPGNTMPPAGGTNGEIGRFNGANTNLGLAAGVFLCTNDAGTHLEGPNDELMEYAGGTGGGGFWPSPDIDLGQLSGNPQWAATGGANIGNKSVLEFDIVPMADLLSVRYVFSSEEYERWVCSQYNDVFGFLISGPGLSGPFTNSAMNVAFIPGSLVPVSINTVNNGQMNAANANGPDFMNPFQPCFNADPNWQANAPYYRYNGGVWSVPQPAGGAAQTEAPYNTDPFYIQHNGMTVVLTASAAVQCGQMYHVKIAVGNVGDNKFPSAVWLEQGSFTSTDRFSLSVDPSPNVEYNATDTTFVENDCDSIYLRFHRWGGFYLDEDLPITVGGTAANGTDVLAALPTSIHFNPLDSFVVVPIAVPVDADGDEQLNIDLITCNGANVQLYEFPITQRPPLEVVLEDQVLGCPDEVTLIPTVTGGSGNPANYTYSWSTGETTPTITTMVLQTTQFWVTVNDCSAGPVTDSAWVTIPPYVPMALTLTPDTAIPCLSNADLEVSTQFGSGGYTYEWTLNGQVQGTTTLLNVPPALPPAYYVITVTDLCGVETADSVLVSQAPPTPIMLTMPPDTAIPCLGLADLTATVSGGGGILQYEWQLGGEVVGSALTINVPAAVQATYTLEVTDQCGQVEQGQVVVTTGPTPPLVIQAEGDTVECPNTPILLQVLSVTGGGGAYTYAWNPGGAGVTGPQYEVTVINDASFTVTVTDQCGNQADTTLVAAVRDHDPLMITVANDTTVCPGEAVPLWAVATGGAGGTTFNWPTLGAGAEQVWIAGHSDEALVVQVTDLCGTMASATIQVGVHPAAVWLQAAELGDSHWRFHAETDPTTGADLTWDMGDGTEYHGPSGVEHAYPDAEAYWVVVTLVTPEGCTAMDSVQTTPPSATLYFPNAFSPNDDGINETFGAEGTLLDRYELLVFDRWGGVIFESMDPAIRWDGTVDGEPVMNGIYQYKYTVKGLKLPLKVGFGHVVLLR